MDHVSRRDLMKLGSAALGLGFLGINPKSLASQPAAAPAVPAARKRALRIAHLTDIHIQPEKGAGEGLAQCLKHAQSHADKPELIVTGGDLVMDSFGADDARTKLQWELLTKTIKEHNGLPIHHTLGNHDIWGWDKKASKTTGDEALWGKKRSLDVLGMSKPWHSHDRNGWHFVHLDSVAVDPANPKGYIGKLGDEQMDWLRKDLAAVKPGTHTLVVTHIPIFSVTALTGTPEKGGTNYKVSGGVLHTDSAELRDLFEKSGTVKACLSGHMHRLDKVEFRGITYCCNGAVSGNWWKGAHAEAYEGYTLVDLFDDGKVDCHYTGYDWKARS